MRPTDLHGVGLEAMVWVGKHHIFVQSDVPCKSECEVEYILYNGGLIYDNEGNVRRFRITRQNRAHTQWMCEEVV